MAERPKYSDYVGKEPKRSPMDCITTLQQGIYFRNGAMNRDGHGPTDNPDKPSEGFGSNGKTLKEVHVYHHASPKD